MKAEIRALGVCVGAASVKLAEVVQAGHLQVVKNCLAEPHDGNPRAALERLLALFPVGRYEYVCVTGRKFKDITNFTRITEPEATEYALRFLLRGREQCFAGLLSLGSENFVYYELDRSAAITNVRTGNKCASGTGEFFLQQIRRMNLPLEEAAAASGAEPYAVSGRCSVFCKSDCTHALNKGIPRERVCAGLGTMIAEKAWAIMGAKPAHRVLAVGGVTKNAYVVQQLAARAGDVEVPAYADVFEALGAALYAVEHKCHAPHQVNIRQGRLSFPALPPLKTAEHLVEFHQMEGGRAVPGDETILGLDVGSTTTKAVLLRTADCRVLASVYLRTLGDPVRAARNCYAEIARQVGAVPLDITALGVTGSGRHIAGLHAATPAIINEIIAHATAAAFFDKAVDTIIEIGGQDAKYTYLINGVPCDYAMNEACSAGTGSFLEEAAKESLNIDYTRIQDIAMQADSPPNFNDQCAAFISSDIKSAAHETSVENIVAGLVYSICMNYCNRVKGARKIGERIFMQGGVCYNRAVPVAMAALLHKKIVVPPAPGLMGAFGVALEVKQRLALSLLDRSSYHLEELLAREVGYGKSFICAGGRESCDLGCTINVLEVNGRKMPFGGSCNRYYNLAENKRVTNYESCDGVKQRQALLYGAWHSAAPQGRWGSVGLLRSFQTNLLLPLYVTFFRELGFNVRMPEHADAAEGQRRLNASFCYPAQIAHGMYAALLKLKPDFVFAPLVVELHVEKSADREPGHQAACLISQAEPFYLRSAFKDARSRILSPVLDFSRGWRAGEQAFLETAKELGAASNDARRAFEHGVQELERFFEARRRLGARLLEEVRADQERVGIVLFGRSYNAFAAEANLGIPQKFASRGVHLLPYDCLPFHAEAAIENMTWASGHDILRAARYVKKDPQLFAAYVTNFSCGPDSFLVGYFRDIMHTKPSLTLEVDSHTADAGVNTRIEAFLDIVDRYRKLRIADGAPRRFKRALVARRRGKSYFVDSRGFSHPLRDPRIKVVFPSMGRLLSGLAAAAFRGIGMNSQAVPVPRFETLMRGRAHTSCKECLPLLLTTGSLVEYVERERRNGELTLYFMPTSNGGCRFTQYYVFLNSLIEKKELADVATFTLTSENGYSGFGIGTVLKLLKAVIVSDALDDIRSALDVLALDAAHAAAVFEHEWQSIVRCFELACAGLPSVLEHAAHEFAKIPLKRPLHAAPRVLMAGEIFVRKDEFSSGAVVESLAKRGIVVQRAPVLEWTQYIDFWVEEIEGRSMPIMEKLEFKARLLLQARIERQIKSILARSGLFEFDQTGLDAVIKAGEHFVDRAFGGETILVIGRFFSDMLRRYHGLISIGPFACLPTRIIESILTPESSLQGNPAAQRLVGIGADSGLATLPFLSIESDGCPFPQVVEARLEAFALQVERVQQRMGAAPQAEGFASNG